MTGYGIKRIIKMQVINVVGDKAKFIRTDYFKFTVAQMAKHLGISKSVYAKFEATGIPPAKNLPADYLILFYSM